MTDKNQPDNFYSKLRILTDEIRKADFLNPRLLEDLAFLLLLRLLSHYSGACRVVRAMKDEHIARLIVAIVDEKTTVGVPPCSTSFCKEVKINNGISADNRETILLDEYANEENPIKIEQRVQKVSRCQISFAFSDELKRVLIVKKLNNYSKHKEIGYVEKDQIIDKLCIHPRITRRLLKKLKMECFFDDDPAASKPNPFDWCPKYKTRRSQLRGRRVSILN